MTTTAEAPSGSRVLPDDARGVLAFARARRAAADAAEVDLLQAAVQWAIIHPAESVEDSESYTLRTGGEAPVGLAGPGAPLVAEFCVAEFGAAVGLTPEAGKYYLGHALELRYRLPRLWEQVLTGTVQAWKARLVAGELDLVDALDLDDAIRGIAGELKDLGCTESLNVRRSMAAGELARRQPALDLSPEVERRAERATKPRNRTRKTVLMVHLTDAALRGEAGHGIGRCENTRAPVTVDTIRDWLRHPDAHVTVKPVIDLAEHLHTDAYEVPDRLREQIALRDQHCVFPWCTRPARACDCDHIQPWRDDGTGGRTCTCQVAPLCRTHHRIKTHGSWAYTTLEPGTYLWTSPHGYHYLRDHTGTLDVSRDTRRP
jgi:hypothetical protein